MSGPKALSLKTIIGTAGVVGCGFLLGGVPLAFGALAGSGFLQRMRREPVLREIEAVRTRAEELLKEAGTLPEATALKNDASMKFLGARADDIRRTAEDAASSDEGADLLELRLEKVRNIYKLMLAENPGSGGFTKRGGPDATKAAASPSAVPAGTDGGSEARKRIDNILFELAYLRETRKYDDIMAKYGAILAEKSASRRAALLDDFVLRCDVVYETARRKAENAEALARIERQLLCAGTARALKAAEKIAGIRESGGSFDLEALGNEAREAIERDIDESNNSEYGKIIKASFEELGYETDEDFETVLVTNSRAVVRKPSMKNYSVNVVTNADSSTFQVELVREVESAKETGESCASDQVRDREVETEFCADFAKVIEALEKKGVTTEFRMKKLPGEVKVKRVLASDASRRSGRRFEAAGGLAKKMDV